MPPLFFHQCRNIVIYDWRLCDIIYNNYCNDMQMSWQSFDSDSLLWFICFFFIKVEKIIADAAIRGTIFLRSLNTFESKQLALCARCKGTGIVKRAQRTASAFPFFENIPRQFDQGRIWSKREYFGKTLIRPSMRSRPAKLDEKSRFFIFPSQTRNAYFCASDTLHSFLQSFITRSTVQGTLDRC